MPEPATALAGTALRRLARHGPGRAAALGLLLALVLAAWGPALVPHDPLAHDVPNRLRPPDLQHPLGTDGFGRDQLARVLAGARTSLSVALAAVSLAALIGTLLGVASATAGGRTDLLLQRLIDALLAFPAVVLALLFVAALGPGRGTVTLALATAFTPVVARVARARCLEVLATEHALAARALGASARRVARRHVLPHVLPTVAVIASGVLTSALVLEAALSYLGLGLPPPAPAWGRMVYEGASLYLETAPWLTVFPGVMLAFVALCAAVLGDALRDVLDPTWQAPAAGRPRAPRGRS